jgi:hypothetical protein
MNPHSFGCDPSVVKKCPHCDTALEFESAGQSVVFTKHDDVFCNAMTRRRVQDLQQALVDQSELYGHAIRRQLRSFDKILTDSGLPSMEERSKRAELQCLKLELTLDARALANQFKR